jgi:NitT/TauT family transport system substrate-binding protein
MIKSLLTRVTYPLAVTAIAATVATSAQAGTLSIGHTTWVGYGTSTWPRTWATSRKTV